MAKIACKIRKRGCSSSSSSSLIRQYRFKRAVLVGKKAGSTTPVPTWITATATTMSSSLAMTNAENIVAQTTKEASVSARKLAATLWESNAMHSPQAKQVLEKKDKRRKAPVVAKIAHSLPHTFSDPSYSPVSEKMDGCRVKSHRRRASIVSQKLQVNDYKFESLDPVANGGFMEIEAHARGKNHGGCIIGTRTRLKDLSSGLATSKELLKVLNRICGLEDQHSTSMSLISALRVELDRARVHVDHLIREQHSNRDGIEHLMRHFAEEKAAWKRKERERIRDAIACIAEELEVEKKLRRQTERLNKKLGKELADTMKEVESEMRAKDILEQVCDELARGVGEDRATLEEMKRESAQVKEEMEQEREMLQFADVLREERVQMKLTEAKYHFEEKNAVVEMLRNELETYLGNKLDEESGDGSPNLQRIKELEAYLKKIDFGSFQMVENDNVGDECEAENSADSDLHSIELNMDSKDMSYKWSYACGDYVEDGSKKIPIEKETKGRKSLSEMISWGSICLEKGSSNSKDWDFSLEIPKKLDYSERDPADDHASQVQAHDYEDEIKRYRSVKSLRDHILSSNKIAPIQSFPSPTMEWSQSEEPGDSIGSPVSKGDGLKPKFVGTISEGRTSAS